MYGYKSLEERAKEEGVEGDFFASPHEPGLQIITDHGTVVIEEIEEEVYQAWIPGSPKGQPEFTIKKAIHAASRAHIDLEINKMAVLVRSLGGYDE